MTPSNLMNIKFIEISRMCVKNMIFTWMNENINIVAQWSNIVLLNIKIRSLEEMLIARENFKNVLDFFYLESICVVIFKFKELRHDTLNEGLTFLL